MIVNTMAFLAWARCYVTRNLTSTLAFDESQKGWMDGVRQLSKDASDKIGLKDDSYEAISYLINTYGKPRDL